MALIKYIISQSAANAEATIDVATGLTVDGRSGWSIRRFTAWLTNGAGVPVTNDASLRIQLNTEDGIQLFTDPDCIASNIMLFQGTAASTGCYQIEPKTEWYSELGRVTVQPDLKIYFVTSGFTAAASMEVQVEYELIKLTDIEVLRLAQGGA